MGNIFKKQKKTSNILMPTDLIRINGIQKYIRLKTNLGGKSILVHGFGRPYNVQSYTDEPVSFDFIDLIEKTISTEETEVDIFFENTKPITHPEFEYSNSVDHLGRPIQSVDVGDAGFSKVDFGEAGRSAVDTISVLESQNNSRFHEINESYEIFKKKNYNWRFDLFESVRNETNSDFEICFKHYMADIKKYINDNSVYSALQKIQKNMYKTIIQFNSDYPTKEELKWIFDPITTICFIKNLYKLSFYKYKNSQNNNINIQNIIIISKNLDKRIQSLIYLFGGKIYYSDSNYSTEPFSQTVNVPIIKKNGNFTLPYAVTR
jgi:hypothetical protein